MMRRFFVGACLIQLFCAEIFVQGKQPFSRVSLKHREHKGVGYNDGYSTLGCFFSPNVSSYATSFFDARLHVFNDAYLASNLGAGARFSSRDQKYIVGLNAYYDYRNYRSLSSHQLASGFEILSRYVDFRLNGYYPFSGLYQDYPFAFGGFEKHSMLIKQKVLYALPCADAEFGFTLPDPFDQIGLYVGLGSYYLFKQHGFNKSVGNIPGGKIRLTAAPAKYLSFGVDYSYDKLFRGRANGFIALNIPIGLSKLRKSQEHHHKGKTSIDLQTQDVVRSEIIPIAKKEHYFPHRDRSGDPLNFVFVNHKKFDSLGVSGGEGTYESPYTTLASAQENSSPGDYIYVFFGDGSDKGYDSGFQFKQNQTLLSSGAHVTVGHVRVPALTPGNYPLITKPQGAAIEALSASQVAMHGFRVEAKQGEAIYVEDTAITLSHNHLKGSADFSAFKVQDAVGSNHIYENTFYGLGAPVSDVAIMEISQDKQGSFYAIDHNQIMALEGQDGLLLKNVKEAKVLYNEFIGSDPSGIAVQCLASDLNSLSHQYHYNAITSGFYEAMHVDVMGLETQDLSIIHNDFASGTLVSGIVYHSDAQEGHLSILSNKIETLAEAVLIDSNSIDKAQIEISDNSFYAYSGSSCISLLTKSPAEVMIASNEIAYPKNLKGSFSGIACELNSEKSELSIKNNKITMNSSNDGIGVINEHDAHIQMENNEVILKGDSKGITVNNQGSGSLFLKLLDNRNVPSFSLINEDGIFQIETSAQDKLQEMNNPIGHYIYKGDVSFLEGEDGTTFFSKGSL